VAAAAENFILAADEVESYVSRNDVNRKTDEINSKNLVQPGTERRVVVRMMMKESVVRRKEEVKTRSRGGYNIVG
jgi:hypothetical protein